MSKNIKYSLFALIALFVLVAGLALVTLVQKAGLEKQNQSLQGQVSDYETKTTTLTQQVKKVSDEAQKFRQDAEQKTRDVDTATRRAEDARKDADTAKSDLSKVQRDKADVESRMTTLRRERDEIVEKLKNRPTEEKVVEKKIYMDQNGQALPADYRPGTPIALPSLPGMQPERTPSVPEPVAPPPVAQAGSTTVVVQNNANEEYWAGVTRQKAALELEVADLKKQLNDSMLKVGDFKKANSDLEVEIGRLKNEKDDIIRKIKYGEDLADSLSVELARARNDQKAMSDRADKASADNQSLRNDIRDLTSTRMSLEKSIAKLTDDKAAIEKRLVETESIIQSRIDEIWQIKKDVDNRFSASKATSNEVELAPIVVNANVAPARTAPANALRHDASVVSVNEENNFVVLNLGEKDGVHVGDTYRIYRGKDQIGAVAVIQVRKDIAAADIKQKLVPFKPGDQAK